MKLNSVRVIIKKCMMLYVAFILLESMVCIFYKESYANIADDSLYMWDYFLYLFYVPDLTDYVTVHSMMNIPTAYIGLAIIASFIVGLTVESDNDALYVLYSQSRKTWIYGKIIGIMTAYTILAGILFLIVCIFGKFTQKFNNPDALFLMKTEFNIAELTNMWSIFVLIPLSLFTIGMVQLFVSLITSAVAGFIFSLVLYLFSMFITNPVFLGNGLIINRYCYFFNGGNTVLFVIVIDIVVLMAALTMSCLIVKRKDFLK